MISQQPKPQQSRYTCLVHRSPCHAAADGDSVIVKSFVGEPKGYRYELVSLER